VPARAEGALRRQVATRLLAAARELAFEAGGAGFTVGQVVAKARSSLKAFYACFPSKDDLLVALFEEDAAIGAAVLEEIVEQHDDPVARLEAALVGLFGLVARRGELPYAAMLVREHLRLAEERPDELQRVLEPFVGLIERELDGARRAGRLSPGHSAEDAALLWRLVVAHLHALAYGQLEEDPEAVGKRVAAFALRGLGIEEPPTARSVRSVESGGRIEPAGHLEPANRTERAEPRARSMPRRRSIALHQQRGIEPPDPGARRSEASRGAGMDLRVAPPRARRSGGLLPDPEPRPIVQPIVSVDDHLIEPPDLFEGRLPRRLQARAPRVAEDDEGRQFWLYENRRYPNVGLNAVVGRPRDEWSMDPARFDQMRPGCYDPRARVADMDVAGIWASLCFPSLVAGFSGAVFSRSADPELGLACMRAWNDWHLEVWAGSAPERIIPLQIPWLADVRIAAEEVRRNAARGCKAVSFPEFPAALGFPSVFSGHWDPFLAACEETGTVVCLHTGASAWAPLPSPDPPFELFPTLFPVNAIVAAAEWLWSGIPLRFPELRIALSEGGMGWVPMLIDRVDYVVEHSASGTESVSWRSELKPSEVLRRNFWFCSIDDPSVVPIIDRIGVEHVLVESDYPHADSTWPDTQQAFQATFGALPEEIQRMVAFENACALFRHPTPPPGDWRPSATGGTSRSARRSDEHDHEHAHAEKGVP
jgi:AcrR family transcriptional regulator/predicted TIM-barrel fold metal-dependent hydrolase